MDNDVGAIDDLVRTFFMAFHSSEVAKGSLDRLPSLFAPDARITVLTGDALRTESVASFIAPRRALLLGGALADFSEWETEGETSLGRDIACRRSRYAKRGTRDGVPFTGAGTKVLTFVRRDGAWRILALLWQDDA